MEIKVKLPKPENTSGERIKGFLRQLELCVHHLQKSSELMVLTEDSYLIFNFPFLEAKQREDDGCYVKVHVDEINEGMQEVEIVIAE